MHSRLILGNDFWRVKHLKIQDILRPEELRISFDLENKFLQEAIFLILKRNLHANVYHAYKSRRRISNIESNANLMKER